MRRLVGALVPSRVAATIDYALLLRSGCDMLVRPESELCSSDVSFSQPTLATYGNYLPRPTSGLPDADFKDIRGPFVVYSLPH